MSLADLIECNEELIARTKQELEQLITDAATETYPSIAKVAEILDVDKSTLWRWASAVTSSLSKSEANDVTG